MVSFNWIFRNLYWINFLKDNPQSLPFIFFINSFVFTFTHIYKLVIFHFISLFRNERIWMCSHANKKTTVMTIICETRIVSFFAVACFHPFFTCWMEIIFMRGWNLIALHFFVNKCGQCYVRIVHIKSFCCCFFLCVRIW